MAQMAWLGFHLSIWLAGSMQLEPAQFSSAPNWLAFFGNVCLYEFECCYLKQMFFLLPFSLSELESGHKEEYVDDTSIEMSL